MPDRQTLSMFFLLFRHRQAEPPRLHRHGCVPTRALLGLFGLLCLLTAHAAEVTPVPGEPLQTLFYSASERSAIDRIRSGSGPEGAPDLPHVIHVNGIVKRQGGGSTAWLNGLPVRDGDAIAPDQRVLTIDGGVRLNGVPVKVGEALDLKTQARQDVVAPGAVTVRAKK